MLVSTHVLFTNHLYVLLRIILNLLILRAVECGRVLLSSRLNQLMADFVLIQKEDEGNFFKNEGEYWQKLTEGEVLDLDLYTACAIGDFGYVKNYLSNAKHCLGIINKKNNGGWTPLMYVCCIGHDKILQLLIQQQVNIEAAEEKHGTTPLMLASSSGNTSVVKRLVEVSIKCIHHSRHRHFHWTHCKRLKIQS